MKSPFKPILRFPEQKLTRGEALRGNSIPFCYSLSLSHNITGMTIDAAYASFTDHVLGSLEVGKLADFTILSQDIMTIPVQDILATKVHATVIDGEVVYGDI